MKDHNRKELALTAGRIRVGKLHASAKRRLVPSCVWASEKSLPDKGCIP